MFGGLTRYPGVVKIEACGVVRSRPGTAGGGSRVEEVCPVVVPGPR
jgi:hypothetical protein